MAVRPYGTQVGRRYIQEGTGRAAAESTSGESMVPGLHHNRMLSSSSALTKLRSLPGIRVWGRLCYGLDVFSKRWCNWELEVIDSLGRWVLGGKCSGNFETCQGRQISWGPLVTLSRNYYIEGCVPTLPLSALVQDETVFTHIPTICATICHA